MGRQLLLYVLSEHTLSARAIQAVKSAERVFPSDVTTTIRYVHPESPAGGPRLPALYFKANNKTVYLLTGSFTAEDIMTAIRRLG